MANIRQTDTPTQTGSGIPGEAIGPGQAALEAELERAEKRLRYAREHPLFGLHPDGVGPTLGQDFRPSHKAFDPET